MFKLSVRTVAVLPLIIASAIVLIGRHPVEGTVSVFQQNEHRVKAILAGAGVTDWTAHSGMGGTLFHFTNGRELRRVESRVLGDAAANAYWIRIRYKTLLPAFSSDHVVGANAQVIN